MKLFAVMCNLSIFAAQCYALHCLCYRALSIYPSVTFVYCIEIE